MKKIKKYLLPVLFVTVISVMGLIAVIPPHKTYSENEKRMLKCPPSFSIESVLSGDYMKELETYLGDQLPLRDFFVGVNSYYSYLIGRNSLSDIYKAKGDYLINAPKEDKIDNFTKNMNCIENFTRESGIKSYLMIVPSAGYIMEDRLPSFAGEYDDDRLFEKASSLTPSINFIDTRGILYDSYTDGKQVYYRTDHHLTSEGTYRLYSEYCSFVSALCPKKEDYDIRKFGGFKGTTYSGSGFWLTDGEDIEIWDLHLDDITVTLDDKENHDTLFFEKHLKKKDMYPVFLDGNHGYVRINNPHASGGNILVIRDSFAQNMAPFLAYNYKNIYLLDMRYYRGSMDEFMKDKKIGQILYLFGIDTLKTDSSTTWLMF